MDSSAAPAKGASPSSEKRRRPDSIRQRVYREKEDFEKANPTPVAVLGPVPSVKDQTAALMRDPSWLVQQLRRQASEDDVPRGTDEDYDDLDLEEVEEAPIFTGHQFIDMEPTFPEDNAEAGREPESEALMGDSYPDNGRNSANQLDRDAQSPDNPSQVERPPPA